MRDVAHGHALVHYVARRAWKRIVDLESFRELSGASAAACVIVQPVQPALVLGELGASDPAGSIE